MITQKMIDNAKNNIFVHVVFQRDDMKEYECIGVIIKSSDYNVHIAFNTISDIVKDSIVIPKIDIISIEKIKKPKVFS